MKKLIILSGLCALWATFSYGQDLISNTISGKHYPAYHSEPTTVAQLIEDRKQQKAVFQELELLAFDPARQRNDYQDVVSEAVFLELDQEALGRFIALPARDIQLSIPVSPSRSITLVLSHINLTTDGFQASTSSGKVMAYEPTGLLYQGIIKGNANSLAAVSIFQDHIRALIADERGNYIVGQLQGKDKRYVLYNDKKLKVQNPFQCNTSDFPIGGGQNIHALKSEASQNAGDCVQIFFECDYAIYSYFNFQPGDVINFVLALSNEVAILYRNEQINIEVSGILIWDNTDPYVTANDTYSALELFGQIRQNNYPGRLAHLLSFRPLGGGRAWVLDMLCYNYFTFIDDLDEDGVAELHHAGPYGVSELIPFFRNFPTYSWSVYVVTHELGHNFGSPHTHACTWNGNNTQIDDCGNFYGEGDGIFDSDNDGIADNGCYNPFAIPPQPLILPMNGGTIMSYCHQLFNVMINFNLGFGPQPGNLIQSKVAGAGCLEDECSCSEFTNRTVNGMPIPSGVYTASNSITSSGDADAPVNNIVIFRAGNWIELTHGFEAEELFVAEVVDTLCDDGVPPLQGAFTLQEIGGSQLIAEPPVTNQLVVWPNPAAEVLNLEYTIAEEGKVSLVILNAYGQVVDRIEENHFLSAGGYRREVPLHHWAAGSYFVALQRPDGRVVQPFLVIKR